MSNDLSELMQKLDQIEQQDKQEEKQETVEQTTTENTESTTQEADLELENTLRREFLGEPETVEETVTDVQDTVEVAEPEVKVDVVPQATETDAVGTNVYNNYEELALHTSLDDLQNLAGLDNEK